MTTHLLLAPFKNLLTLGVSSKAIHSFELLKRLNYIHISFSWRTLHGTAEDFGVLSLQSVSFHFLTVYWSYARICCHGYQVSDVCPTFVNYPFQCSHFVCFKPSSTGKKGMNFSLRGHFEGSRLDFNSTRCLPTHSTVFQLTSLFRCDVFQLTTLFRCDVFQLTTLFGHY